MARLLKLVGWFFAIALCAVFFLSVGSALLVRSAVADGALEIDYGPCRMVSNYKSNPFVMNHVDSAMWRAIVGPPLKGESSSGWRLRALYVHVGMKLAFAQDRRRELILPRLEALPLCERASSKR